MSDNGSSYIAGDLATWLAKQGFAHIIAVKVKGDKVMRMAAQTPMIEAGRVFIPHDATWLPDYLHELMMFPKGRFDYQVDSTSQALAHIGTTLAGANRPRRPSCSLKHCNTGLDSYTYAASTVGPCKVLIIPDRSRTDNMQQRTLEMAEKIRWGILATGWIADLFVKDLLLTGHSITAVGSRTEESAKRFAKEFGIANAHGSYAALAADPNVDVIYIATPHPHHVAAAKMALHAGKHILVEKPFTINAREAAEIVALAKTKNLVVLEAMWTRFLPHMRRIREIIAARTIGDIRSLIADHTQKLPEDPKHRLNDLALGGGALLDLAIYPISFAWDILGKPAAIKASATFKATGADAQVATIFHYGSGAIATTLSSSDSAGSNRASIAGTKGRIEIDHVWYTPTTFRVYDSSNSVIETFDGAVEGRGMQFQADEAERLIASGVTAGEILPPAQSVEIMQTLDEIRAQIGLKYPSE